MNLKYNAIARAFYVLASGALFLIPMRTYAQGQGAEELTRGPVHEAFAKSVGFDPEPGILVKSAPPDLIEEIPPDQRPGGDNIAWIPGYWGWDEEQTEFIWISGVWRNLPPDRQWVPGYWGNSNKQWQWTSGYWDEGDSQEVAYLPRPPKSVESGPNVAAPSNNDSWIPGNWVYRDTRYAWTPGYWEPARANWVWTPGHYQWTHNGYIFVGGYWDYAVANRGVMFAPVRFRGDTYRRPGYSYTPLMVISLNVFANHLFVRPSYGHYYFGDYYSPKYRNEGYYDSYSYSTGRRGYDPIYAYNRWDHRDDRNWERNRRDRFVYYRDNEAERPPRTWAAFQALSDNGRRGDGDDFQIAQPLASYVESRKADRPFQKVNKEGREKLMEQREQVREFGKKRQQIESRASETGDKEGEERKVTREKFDRSPLIARRAEQLPAGEAPPEPLVSREPKEKADAAGEKPATGRGSQPDEINRSDQEPGKMTPPSGRPERREIPREKPGADKEKLGRTDAEPKRGQNAPKTPAEQSKEPSVDQIPGINPNPARPQRPKADSKPEAEPKPSQKAQPERQPASEEEQAPRVKPNPSQKAEPQREVAPERKQAPRAEPERRQNPGPEPRVTPERKQVPRAEPETRQKAEPRRPVAPERKQAPRAEPEPRATPERKQAPRPEPETRQKPESQRQAAPERRQAPRAEPQPNAPTPPGSSGKPGGKAPDAPDEKADDKKERGR